VDNNKSVFKEFLGKTARLIYIVYCRLHDMPVIPKWVRC
jgi:hypothetical protein